MTEAGKGRIEVSSVDGFSGMLDLLELRTSIESDAAALAAARRTDEHLREMRKALNDFELHLTELGETVTPDFRFHLAIAQATGNRCFSELMVQLGTAVIPRTRVSSSWLDVEQRAPHLLKVNQEHQDIYAAIERRDPEAARAAMRIHLTNSRERQRVAYADLVAEGSSNASSLRRP
jgi:DNA-binding FadR family transcriptional regulator